MGNIVEELAHHELFHGVPESVLHTISVSAQPLDLTPGEVLLSPERENDCVYLLLSGVLTVHFGTPDSPPIRELALGTSVGELSIIDGTVPSAYVIAKETSRVFPVSSELIQRLFSDNPIALNLMRMLTLWLRGNTQRIVKDRLLIWELNDQANVDGLTGLYNRRWLNNTLERLLVRMHKDDQSLCLLMVDADHFKRYNDTHGHLGGDHALKAIGDVLKTTVRPFDCATRYGGEEFLILLPNTRLADANTVAERIRSGVEKWKIVSPDGTPLPGVTVSIGLAISDADSTAASLIGAADAQLYRAKNDGRNCVRFRLD